MASRSPIEDLPSELVQHILDLLPDVKSLLSTILTCSSVYNAFTGDEVQITSQVVKNRMDVEVLPEAVAAVNSSHLAPWTLEPMQKFVNDQLLSRQTPQSSWTLSDALFLESLHCHVEYFALDFASQALAKLSVPGDANAMLASPLTPDELHRTQRAFYRFEIYCNLFKARKPQVFDIHEHRGVFFSNFSPWENEQLGCIHDYLFNVVALGMHHVTFFPVLTLTESAFNEITDHDVAWGASGIEDAFDLDLQYVQHILSLGLAYLHAVATAETYEERYGLLSDSFPKGKINEFLHEGLNLANEPGGGVELSEYDQNDEEDFSRHHAPFVHESDPGPATAWRWAHQHETRATFVYADSQSFLRERGYVLWDLSRLEAWPVFQQHWEPPDTTAASTDRASYRAALYLREKCKRRSQIYKLGGRGWWSPDDESKVVYLPGVGPAPKIKRGVGKTSQQAADDLQRQLVGSAGAEHPTWRTWEPRMPSGASRYSQSHNFSHL